MNLNPASSIRPPGIRMDGHAFKTRVDTGRNELGEGKQRGNNGAGPAETRDAGKSPDETRKGQLGQEELTPRELREVESLKQRDIEVRAHERSHASAGGQYVTGGISLQYRTGPDGRRYAVAGEVRIDTSAVAGNPRATETKMQAIQRAALAPANPSAQDRRVAAKAAQLEIEARAEIIEMGREQGTGETGESNTSPDRRYPRDEPEKEKGRFIDIAV